jgi:hypothetical protein
LEEADGPQERELRARSWSWLWLIVAGVALLVRLLALWGQIRTARRLGLSCPSCGALLVVKKYRCPALGAGKCGRCQARVVEDAPACGVTLPTRQELLTRVEEYHADSLRWDPKCRLLLLCFLPFLLAALAAPVVGPLPPQRGLAILWPMVFLVVLCCPLFVYVHYLGRWEGRLLKSHSLACGWCGAALRGARGRAAAATGRCGLCGQPAVSDPA